MDRIRDRKPRRLLIQAIVIAIAASLLGLVANAVSPNGITMVGTWRVAFDSTGIVKPEYFEEDDTLVTVDQAMVMYQANSTVFVDARYPDDYYMNHIKGAVLLPFDEYDDYIASFRENVAKDAEIITYCGEEDCDLSLYLARLLRSEEGYTNVYTLYGGYELWVRAGLPVEEEGSVHEDGEEQ